MNCCIEKKKAREEMAHKSQSADTDEFETGNLYVHMYML